MFFVISNKPFLQTEGHHGYGTAILYNFSFLISIFVLLTHKKALQTLQIEQLSSKYYDLLLETPRYCSPIPSY